MGKELLHNCRACGREISRESRSCPHCGQPQESSLTIWLIVLFGVLCMAVFIAFYCYCACLCK